MAFGAIYAIHIELFPPYFIVASFGLCNFFCRGVTMLAPFVAESENAFIPLSLMIVLNLLAFLSSFALIKRTT